MSEVDFDKEAVYDEKVMPLLKQAFDVCREHDMPMLAVVCYAKKSGLLARATNYVAPENENHADAGIVRAHSMLWSQMVEVIEG